MAPAIAPTVPAAIAGVSDLEDGEGSTVATGADEVDATGFAVWADVE